MKIDKIFELDEIAKKDAHKYTKKRFLFDTITELKGKHFKGIIGPRGTGKTILLKQLANYYKKSIYISADTLDRDEDLFSLLKELNKKYDIRNVFIDEIHFNIGYAKHLKNIYDFLELNLFFTSSVAISLETSYDLSRRVNLYLLSPFSFREYIFFNKDILLKEISFDDILSENFNDYPRYEYLFKDYLSGGNYPISIEENNLLPLLSNILKKIIYSDIAVFGNLNFNELDSIENIVKFIGKSHVEGISFSSVSKNTGITKYKAIQYLKLLEKSFVINIVYPKGTNVLKEPKVLMRVPYRLLYRKQEDVMGYLKEDFFIDMLKAKGIKVYYLKSKQGRKIPDYLVQTKDKEIVVEIGGKGKGFSQFKGIKIKDKLILTYPSSSDISKKKPLFLVGFLY